MRRRRCCWRTCVPADSTKAFFEALAAGQLRR